MYRSPIRSLTHSVTWSKSYCLSGLSLTHLQKEVYESADDLECVLGFILIFPGSAHFFFFIIDFIFFGLQFIGTRALLTWYYFCQRILSIVVCSSADILQSSYLSIFLKLQLAKSNMSVSILVFLVLAQYQQSS